MLLSTVLLIAGFVLLICGANAFVEGASALANHLKVPKIIIGLTVVAIGTSIPEMAVTISSALHGANGMAVGNVLGSNIANILLILGVTSMITPLAFKKKTIKYEIPFVIFITILLMWFGMRYGAITRPVATLLLMIFLLFVGYLYINAKKEIVEAEQVSKMPLSKISLFLILGAATLIFGSKLTVNSAIDLANMLHVPNRIIGLTLLAVGTSLPELVTCIIAARKKHVSLVIGNIIGSNIFNILIVLGSAGLIYPIDFEFSFLIDAAIAIVVTTCLWLFAIYRQRLTRNMGLFFLTSYLVYLVYLTY